MRKETAEQIRTKMQAVKSSGSKIETTLAKALWKNGHRYRKNNRSVFGTPDLTFKQIKMAIFVDSEFWHGKNWKVRKYDHKTNKIFWHNKIERNIRRDKIVNRILRKDGWCVLRFWGEEIVSDLEKCVKKIELAKQRIEAKHRD